MMRPEDADCPGAEDQGCLDTPPFDRLTYFHGQLLSPQHLRREQQTHYERARLHNRCLHGWGVVCGLEVKPGPWPRPDCHPEGTAATQQPPEPEGEAEALHGPGGPRHSRRTRLWVDCGLALDPQGNELLVREPLLVDVLGAMSPQERHCVQQAPGRHTLYVSLRHHSFGIEPSRPLLPDVCGMPAEAVHAFLRDGVCVEVSLRPPEEDWRCETCCPPHSERRVLLARIESFTPGQPLEPGQLSNAVRRYLGRSVPTVITGVGWQHGGTYRPADVDELLWGHGLRVRFSRPVHAETLAPGVFDVLISELGSGRSGMVRMLRGELVLPPGDRVSELTYRLTERERVDPGDRLHFVLRTDFILDGCCEPVHGHHLGGRVPDLRLPGHPLPVEVPPVGACPRPPHRFGPWTSGGGAGGTFESWIFTEENPRRRPPSGNREEESR